MPKPPLGRRPPADVGGEGDADKAASRPPVAAAVSRPGRSLGAVFLLLAALAAPALEQAWWPAVGLAAFAIGAAILLPPGRQRWTVVLPLAVAAAALLWGDYEAQRFDLTSTAGQERAARAYRHLWGDLEAAARVTATRLPPDREDHVGNFDRLSEAAIGDLTVALVDPDGTPREWFGPGLLHDLTASDLPPSGPTFAAGFRSVTLAYVLPLDDSRRPWRMVSARTDPVDRLPFGAGVAGPLRWSLIDQADEAHPESHQISVAGYPTLVVRTLSGPRPQPWRSLSWWALGVALLGLCWLRRPQSVQTAVLAAGGVAAWGWALAASPPEIALAAFAAALAAWAGSGRLGAVLPLAGITAAATFGAALGLQWAGGSDPSPDAVLPLAVGRLTLTLVAFAGLRLIRPRAGAAGGVGGLIGGAVLLVGAALQDFLPVALLALVLGTMLLARWLARGSLSAGTGRALLTLSLAAAVAALAWGSAQRLSLRQELKQWAVDWGQDGAAAQALAWSREVSAAFEGESFEAFLARSPEDLERQDLALALWQDSPLARLGTLSALQVEPFEGPPSTFGFGLSVDGDPSDPALRQGAEAADEITLTYRGEPWGCARFRLWVGPAFGLSSERDPNLEGTLLRSASETVSQLPAGAELESAVVVGDAGEQPSGDAGFRLDYQGSPWHWRLAVGPAEVLRLPVLGVGRALLRAGSFVLGVLLVAGIVAALAVPLTLPPGSLAAALQRVLRSYSKRLVLVYTLLLLLPLIVLDLLLLATVERRLVGEQQRRGLLALETAEGMVRELLSTPQPGFGIDPSFADERMKEIAATVRNDVNLYWRNRVYASSRSELYAAGLLPARIPGDIHHLFEQGSEVRSRVTAAGATSYLELYAAVRVPGSRASGGFVLAMPLLAEQKEVARELADHRRQVAVITAALCALLITVGSRLARNFTTPLTELVEGTRRIAAGEESLGLAPRELELASLVEAVDEMAGKIAEGRAKLIREKQVVDRMVENITAGIVSVDREGRVMMRNRVASDLLRLEIGDPLREAFRDREAMAPLRAFLARVRDRAMQETVELPAAGEQATEGGREWNLVWVPLPGEREPAALLVVEDITETLQGQRLAAWAEMARIIAHEIKNPLTPIRLNVEHMQQVWGDGRAGRFEAVFERCTSNVLAQVAELQQIASEFSTYSSILQIDPQLQDLREAMADLVGPYVTAPPEGVEVSFVGPSGDLMARFDRKLLGRAIRNLIENALRASAGGGVVTVELASRLQEAKIAVRDSGPGVPTEDLGRIFDPYFSTHDSGTGLGLPIARRVVREHGGSIQARNRSAGGLEVVITIPLGWREAEGADPDSVS
ncbi:MAG: ATP-binding protein [Acidobacteriota bacterium]